MNSGGQTQEECEADGGRTRNATFCTPEANGMKYTSNGLGTRYDSYYCGSKAIDWTNLTGQSDKPINDICNAPLDEDAFTYRADGSVLTCFGRTNRQVLDAWCDEDVNLVHGLPKDNASYPFLTINYPGVVCLYRGANCDKIYCQTCDELCAGPPPAAAEGAAATLVAAAEDAEPVSSFTVYSKLPIRCGESNHNTDGEVLSLPDDVIAKFADGSRRMAMSIRTKVFELELTP